MNRLAQIARALGGNVAGADRVLAPGPGHSARDRSLSVLLDANAPDGFRVNSFASDDWQDCRDHVRAALGLGPFAAASHRPRDTNPCAPGLEEASRTALAREIWNAGRPIGSTPGEAYMHSRGLPIDAELLAGHVLRFHPNCPFKLDSRVTVRIPAMLAAMVDIRTNEFRGVHRTALKPDGSGKSGIEGLGNPKKMLGPAAGACVKLSPDEDVTLGLHITEGIETGLACMRLGFRPTWAAMSAGGMERFPVLGGIEALTIFADQDETGIRAAQACSNRWVLAGKEVTTIVPEQDGSDFADRCSV